MPDGNEQFFSSVTYVNNSSSNCLFMISYTDLQHLLSALLIHRSSIIISLIKFEVLCIDHNLTDIWKWSNVQVRFTINALTSLLFPSEITRATATKIDRNLKWCILDRALYLRIIKTIIYRGLVLIRRLITWVVIRLITGQKKSR